jgi:hypothetical protein
MPGEGDVPAAHDAADAQQECEGLPEKALAEYEPVDGAGFAPSVLSFCLRLFFYPVYEI